MGYIRLCQLSLPLFGGRTKKEKDSVVEAITQNVLEDYAEKKKIDVKLSGPLKEIIGGFVNDFLAGPPLLSNDGFPLLP